MKSRPWVIHQFFVDETQDFTQAELCLLIRLCQNPNDMFLTGKPSNKIITFITKTCPCNEQIFFELEILKIFS